MALPKNRFEYEKMIADLFVKSIEDNKENWEAGWNRVFFQRNGISNKPYKASNQLLLNLVASSLNYKDPRWFTYVQIKDINGKYHPGKKWKFRESAKDKGIPVVYPIPYDFQEKKYISWEEFQKAPEDAPIKIVRRYTAVFNADLIEGVPELNIELNKEINENELISKLSKNMGVPIKYSSIAEAFYKQTDDTIYLPNKELFFDQESLNATTLHEFAHATGSEKRLDRFSLKHYALERPFEELVAEISSCFMGYYFDYSLNEKNINNHKAYVKSWIEGIKDKPQYLMKAIKEAEKASNYICLKSELITQKEYDEQNIQDYFKDNNSLEKTISNAKNKQNLNIKNRKNKKDLSL